MSLLYSTLMFWSPLYEMRLSWFRTRSPTNFEILDWSHLGLGLEFRVMVLVLNRKFFYELYFYYGQINFNKHLLFTKILEVRLGNLGIIYRYNFFSTVEMWKVKIFMYERIHTYNKFSCFHPKKKLIDILAPKNNWCSRTSPFSRLD